MVHALGGPVDFCDRPASYLTGAPVQKEVWAERAGWVSGMATRDIGLQVIALGGGRHQATDTIDPRVGFSSFAQIGQRVERGGVLAVVHAADDAAAQAAALQLRELIAIGEEPVGPPSILLECVN
jgi:thymidine phosphorylase